MNLHWLDWLIIVLLLGFLVAITAYIKRYTKSVADFLAANRLAGRYMLTLSNTFYGAISLIAIWEMVYDAGLPTQWWGMIGMPVGLIIGISGFIVYRFRQTRALTLAQFFETRYSRRFRYFSGILCWISGIVNYGIFPAITARFIIYFFGLPEHFNLSVIDISTFPLVMLIYLGTALYIACSGGQVSIMVADFCQGILLMLIFLILMCFLMYKFDWNDIIAGLLIAPEGKSMVNPFKTGNEKDFSVWFFLIGVFSMIYNARSWQGNSGFNAAAKTPHEAQMAGIISQWRQIASGLCLLLIPMAAYAILHLPKFAAIAAPAKAQIAVIADPQIQIQMTVPLVLANILPVGMMGLFAAIIVACAISCDNSYIHSWGTIFIQDVVMPIRNKPLDPKRHLLWLRVSIFGVAAFGFAFSMLFPLKDFILMFFALTGAIYLGGAGAVIIGGLYWKRGTTEAAWTALILGTALAFGGMMVQQFWGTWMAPLLLNIWPGWQWLVLHKDKFPVNGQEIYFYAMAAASLSYILVSLSGPRRVFDMDKMLHRGKYAIKDDTVEAKDTIKAKRKTFGELIGISSEFSRFERFLFWGTFWWTIAWWGTFIVGTIINLFYQISDSAWSWFWWFKLWWFSLILGTICTFWILCGGIRDAFRMFRDLKHERIDESDDGTVKKII
jgi:SSS family solute:Na+ symporter